MVSFFPMGIFYLQERSFQALSWNSEAQVEYYSRWIGTEKSCGSMRNLITVTVFFAWKTEIP
jgi:hypothetical protein